MIGLLASVPSSSGVHILFLLSLNGSYFSRLHSALHPFPGGGGLDKSKAKLNVWEVGSQRTGGLGVARACRWAPSAQGAGLVGRG